MNSGIFQQVSKKNFKQWHSDGKFELVAALPIEKSKLEQFLETMPPEECDVMPTSRLDMTSDEKCYIWSNGKWEYFVVMGDTPINGKHLTIIYRSSNG